MRYELDVLIKNKWIYVCESDEISEIDKNVISLTSKGENLRILDDGNVLIFLNGSEESQYSYWKNEYVNKENNNVSSYLKQKKKQL